MFNTDLPISGANGDRLGRGEIARSIACALYAQDSGEPLVLGISGKWGTGKTSLANLVIEKLMEAENANSSKAKTMVFQYSAWMAANGDGLVSRFLDQFSGFLCQPNRSLEAKKIGEKLVRYSKCFTPFSLLPGVGGLSELIKKTFESVGEASKGIGDQLAVDVQGCKQEISEALKTGKQRVLIIFDDIDRLTVREIQQVFQLIKAVADFPFTSYLLLYDEEIVCQALNEITGSEGHDFLGKIIQVPIRIPLPQASQIYGVLFEELDRIVKGSTLLFFEQEYWVNVFHHGLKGLFRHLRDVKRFTNLLQFKIAALTDQK